MSAPTARLVLFGHPVAHSLSPRIQQAFAAQFGVDIDYGLADVPPADFAAAVRAFFADGGRGANVTVPHKRAAFELAGRASEAAAHAGVANVLRPDGNGLLLADNTDGSGLVADLRRRGLALRGQRVLLLGAGGAARGVAGPLLDAGIASLVIANRTQARAQALAAQLGARATATAMAGLGGLPAFDLVIHATSAGHAGMLPTFPDTLVNTATVCCDLSYGEAAQPFLGWARRAGAGHVFDGLGMLVETAAASFELWFGRAPDTEAVLRQMQPSRGTL